MSEPAQPASLYLIAHRVRGEPAFDIASQVQCPECQGEHSGKYASGCVECDSFGYWWVIPTSGHRAYPYESQPLLELIELSDWPPMPEGLPDHYQTHAAPAAPPRPSGLTALLAQAKRKSLPTIDRRGF